MDSSDFVTEETSVVIVSLNISQTNITTNGTMPKAFRKRTEDDSSINSIIFGIGVAVVVLILILIVFKLICKCYKMYKEVDEKPDPAKNSPLLPSPSASVVRRKSSIRNPTASMHRSSLPVETLMDFQQKRLSGAFIDIPPKTRNQDLEV